MSDYNLTVALDTVRHQYVCAPTDPADPVMDELRAGSYRGDRSLVCALCYAGVDAAPGTRVPLVLKGRIGGARRPHFAHPPGHGPVGGQHEPESVWHLASKEALVGWARTQPGVVEVGNEVWLPDRARRCDVRVVFTDGGEIALEAQSSRLTDADWRNRHRDYQVSGVVDVWLWHHDGPIPWGILDDTERSQHVWMLDPWKSAVTLMVGAPHQHQSTATAGDVNHRVQHLPPCIGDNLVPYEFSLSDLVLTPRGIAVPDELGKQLAERLESERRRIRDVENACSPIHSRTISPEALSIMRSSSGAEVDEIEAVWPVIRAKAREFGGGVVYALLSGVSVVRLEADTVVLAHQHAPLAQRLTMPKYAEALRAAIHSVLGRDVHVQWPGSAVSPLRPTTGNGAPRRSAPRGAQRFDIQATHVEDFDEVFDLLQLAGARYGGSNREFVVERPTFTFEQVWALIELVRHPEQPKVESPWRPKHQP